MVLTLRDAYKLQVSVNNIST